MFHLLLSVLIPRSTLTFPWNHPSVVDVLAASRGKTWGRPRAVEPQKKRRKIKPFVTIRKKNKWKKIFKRTSFVKCQFSNAFIYLFCFFLIRIVYVLSRFYLCEGFKYNSGFKLNKIIRFFSHVKNSQRLHPDSDSVFFFFSGIWNIGRYASYW